MSRNWVILPPLLSLGLNTLEKTIARILPTFEIAIISQVNCNIGWRKKGKDKGLVHPYWIYHGGKCQVTKQIQDLSILTTFQRSINLYFIYT